MPKEFPSPQLSEYRTVEYSPGAGVIKRAFWYVLNAVIFDSWLCPFSVVKSNVLRMFGASLGCSLVIKPRVNIKHPWRLTIGDNVWLGEGVWIDNVVEIDIGSNVCISQGAVLLTGNHDYKDPTFALMAKRIVIEDGVWIGAFARICPGVRCGRNAVVTVGSVLRADAEPSGIYSGNPAAHVRRREIRKAKASFYPLNC